MARDGVALIATIKTTENKTVQKNIDFANPEASDNNVKTFIKSLSSLSKNSLQKLQKTQTSNIDLGD
jgi:hypothetical protein